MKSILIFSLLLFAGVLNAQSCAEMLQFARKGLELEYTNYDKKGNVQSVVKQKVTDVHTSADTVIAIMESQTFDKKEQKVSSGVFPMKCYQNSIFIDMRAVVPSQSGTMNNSSDMRVEVNGTDMSFPANMKPGQTLPDCEIELQMWMGTMKIMNSRYAMRNRKVEARENVTTSAGTFDCLKISYDFEYNLMGQRIVHTEYWFNNKVGMVKTLNYDKKGEPDTSMELTKM